MENCLVTKLKGTVDNSDFRFDYLNGIIITYNPNIYSDFLIEAGTTDVLLHVVNGKLYSDSSRTTEIENDYTVQHNVRKGLYPSTTEDTTIVVFNKSGVKELNTTLGRIKISNLEGMIEFEKGNIFSSSSLGAFIEGSADLLDIVKMIYKNKTSYKDTYWNKDILPYGFLIMFNTLRFIINGKEISPINCYFRFTTNDTPVSGNSYLITEGPIDVYTNNENYTERVLTYNPSTDKVTYYGRFI